MAYLRRLQIIPVAVDKDRITIATYEPYVQSWIGEVQGVTAKQVQIVVASSNSSRYFIEEFCTVRLATQEFRRKGIGRADEYRRSSTSYF
jgi:hypothetical protein